MDSVVLLTILSIFLRKVGDKATDIVVETCAKKALSLTAKQSKNLWTRFPVARRHEFQAVSDQLTKRLPPESLGKVVDVEAADVEAADVRGLVERLKALIQDPEVITAIDALSLDEVDAVIEAAQSQSCFVYGPAVAPEGFYGRSRLIRDVRSRIGGVHPQCVNVVGMRRAGEEFPVAVNCGGFGALF
ncbi:MAG: hypothetical protein ACFCBU_12470 [Cyanophyceae cyanobacterium]